MMRLFQKSGKESHEEKSKALDGHRKIMEERAAERSKAVQKALHDLLNARNKKLEGPGNGNT